MFSLCLYQRHNWHAMVYISALYSDTYLYFEWISISFKFSIFTMHCCTFKIPKCDRLYKCNDKLNMHCQIPKIKKKKERKITTTKTPPFSKHIHRQYHNWVDFVNSIMQIHHPLRQTDSGVPSLEEAAAVVQAQTGYCQQLEAENRYIKVG